MIRVERCLTGRLAPTYPVSKHDVELVVDGIPLDQLAAVLREESDRVLRQYPACRRVVFATPVGELRALGAAQEAGFRHVVDVDLHARFGSADSLSLLVRESESRSHEDPDRIPGT